MSYLPNPTIGEDPWGADLNDRLDDLEAHIEAGGGTPGSAGSEYIDCTQAPYNMVSGTNYQGGDGTARNGSDATKGFRKAVYDATITGKTLWIPPGTYDMRMSTGSHPNALIFIDMTLKKRRVIIRGCGMGVTILDWSHVQLGTVTDPTDLLLGGDPSGRVANFAIDEWMSNNTNTSLDLSDLTLQGPGSYATVFAAEQRGDGWGLRMGGRARVERVEITGFHSAVCYRMRGGATSSTQDHNIDHNTLRDCYLHDNFYNQYWSYYWPVSGANSGDGDHVVENCSMSQAAKAVRAVDPAAAVFDSRFTSCHAGFSPFGWYSEYGPQGVQTLPGTATIARDAAGVITIDTKTAAVASAPWGPFDNNVHEWNNGGFSASFGFILGDVVQLAAGGTDSIVATGGHGSGSFATDGKNVGRVTGKTGTTLTILMEHPVVGTAFTAATVTAGGIRSHYNQQRMLDSNIEFDGTYEGCGNANIFAPNRLVQGYATATQIPFHSLMSVDNNKGSDNAYSPTPVYSLVRVSSGGGVYTTTGRVPAGTKMQVDDNWFINTITANAGAIPDDNPPSSSYSKDPDRIRGVQRILSVTDNTDGGTTLTFTFQQTGSLTAKTLGNPANIASSAGTCGRVAAFVIQLLMNCEGPTFDCTAHPPDLQDIGGKLAAIELVVQHMEASRFHMLQETGFYPRLMSGNTSDTNTIPIRSLCVSGDREMPITHTAAAVAAGDILEFRGRDDVRPYQGGTLAGVALWSRAANDFILYISKGILRSETGYDAQGVKSTIAFTQGDDIYADKNNAGLATNLANRPAGAPIIGRCTVNSTGPVGGIYTTAIRVDPRMPVP